VTLDPGAQAPPSDAHPVHCLFGEPSEVLPRFVSQSDYDLVVMGKPRQDGPYEPAGSVAARVVKASAGDVLFVGAVVVDALGEPTGRQDRGRAVTGVSAGSSARRRPEP
jgi:hypothetical protein